MPPKSPRRPPRLAENLSPMAMIWRTSTTPASAHFASGAAPWLLELLRSHGLSDGLVIDLGCGSGIWAHALSTSGYGVLGYDISPAMVAMCRRRVPRGEFYARPLLIARLRPCVAVTAIGEVFNYLFDKRNTPDALAGLFQQVHAALRPSGLFVFDVATPGRVPGGHRRSYTLGADWACLFEAEEDAAARTVTRRITTFRRVEQAYRRVNEVHRLRLYDPQKLLAQLRKVGFNVAHREKLRRHQIPARIRRHRGPEATLRPGVIYSRLRERIRKFASRKRRCHGWRQPPVRTAKTLVAANAATSGTRIIGCHVRACASIRSQPTAPPASAL